MIGEIQIDNMEQLRAAGFEGFQTVVGLREEGCAGVPVEQGVYVVVRDWTAPPRFLPSSIGGWYRGAGPTVSSDELIAKWVADACVLYIGRAEGGGVRSRLQQRLKRYLRFGLGKVVDHPGGRYIWQLGGSSALRLAWCATGDESPAALEARLHAAFLARHGMIPFANLAVEPEA